MVKRSTSEKSYYILKVGGRIAISLTLRFGALAMRQHVLELFPFYRAGGALQLAPPAAHATCKLSLIMRCCLVEM